MGNYIHGFDEIEQKRLVDQSHILENKIFEKIDFSNKHKILEVGCGVGAQIEILLNKYPKAHVTGIELSEIQLQKAKAYLATKFDSSRFDIYQMNAEEMKLEDNEYDAVYICWVLEHASNPQKIINECFRVLKRTGSIVITEVQNNNFYLSPLSEFITSYWNKYNQLQLEMGGNPYVGVEIGNYLSNANFSQVDTYAPTFLYDNCKKEKRTVMIDFWANLMLSGFNSLLENNKVIPSDRENLITEMDKAKNENGVFYYSFIQAQATKK